MLRFLPVKSVLIVSAFYSGAHATDWTEFRGPNGQGHADFQDLPITWSETENVAWKVPVSGIGWSSPVVRSGRIFLTTAVEDGSEHSLRVISLDAASGKELWNVEVFRQAGEVKMHSKNSHASPTAIVEGDRLFVHFGPHGTACLTIDGDIEWKNDKLTYAPVHGNGGSPAISGSVMIICCDGSDNRFVVGLDKNTGKEAWRTERELDPSRGFSFSTPTIINAEGRSMAICPGSGGVWAYDPESGKQLWRVAYGEGYSVVPRPVFGHGLVYVCSGFGDGQLIAIDPTGSGDVTESHVKWKTKKGVPKSPSVLLVGDEIYMVDDKGIATCLDAVSGKQHWQERLGGGFSASPTYADGRIYFQNETGETTVVRPGTKYEEIAKNKIGDGKLRTFASFAFVDNAILLRNETHLYRLQKTEAAGQ